MSDQVEVTRNVGTIVIGIVVAAVLLFGLWSASQPSDTECIFQRAEVADGTRSPFDLHDSCR